MVDVFISYKREERARCERIHQKLTALGLDVWFDSRLTPGESFRREIRETVNAAKTVVVLWSPQSVESDFVVDEAAVGKKRGVLAAIKIAPCELPLGFRGTHCEDMFEEDFADDHPSWLKTLTRIGEKTDRPLLTEYSRTLGEASKVLYAWADQHHPDPLSERMRNVAQRLVSPTTAAPPAPVHRAIPIEPRSTAPPPRDPAAARWTMIEQKVDPRDYTDFLEVFATSEHAFDARRHRRQIEDWVGVDKKDHSAVTAFLNAGVFPALDAVARGALDALAREAAQAKQLERALGPKTAKARAAAIAHRPIRERCYTIDVAGLANWPRPTMVAIPPGRFEMGAATSEAESRDNERPVHEVAIAHCFSLASGPVTLGDFTAFIAETKYGTGDSAFVWTGDKWENTKGKGWRDPGFVQAANHPVTCVSFDDAHAFLDWLNTRLGLMRRVDAYRLPSEAEWEYACRAGTTTPFSFGDTITTDQANFDGNSSYGPGQPSKIYRQRTTPVGEFAANPFGVHDMHGNVWEWCEDTWRDTYAGAPDDGSVWEGRDASRRVVRGGSWVNGPQDLRSALRIWLDTTNRLNGLGFRLARTLSLPES